MMNDMLYAGNKVLYLVLILSAGPICVATVVGILVGLIQTITQLQEQTLPFGIKLLSVTLCLFLLSGWYSEIIVLYAHEVVRLAFARNYFLRKFDGAKRMVLPLAQYNDFFISQNYAHFYHASIS